MSSTVHRLIERSAELGAVDEVLAQAAAGRGTALVVSGQAGLGKTALVLHAQETARRLGFTVLASYPTPVSGTLAHGVVRDWVGPIGSLDHALSRVLENLTESGPLLLVVDDVQWADTGSLQLLDLLSARLAHSPVVLLLGRRTGEASLRPDILERVAARGRVLVPQPLSVIGVDQMRQLLPSAPEADRLSSAEVHRLTGGLPFLVRELLRAGPDGVGQPPRSVVESVKDRLSRLGRPAVEIASTVALLGDEATFDALGALCGLSVAELADPLEVLTDADIVTLGLWRAWPSHPLVREAILASMTPSQRSAQHERAAAYLRDLGRPRQVVASHLVHTLPGEDLTVVQLLRAAAEESLESGAPQVAAAQLLRAVGETTPADTDPQLLRRAAAAHMRAGLVDQAFDLWARALERMPTAQERALCLGDLAHAQMTVGDRTAAAASYATATGLLVAEGHDASSQPMRLLLARTGMARMLHDGSSAVMDGAVTAALAQPTAQDTHADRLLFALHGAGRAVEGRDHARARDLARRAVDGETLLAEETSDGNGFYLAVSVLCWADAVPEALAAIEAALQDSRRRGSPLAFAKASCARGYAHYRLGNLRQAVSDVEAALGMREHGWHGYSESALATLARAHLGLGQLAAAQAIEPELRAVAGRGDLTSAVALTAAGFVRASSGDHEQALRDYRAVRRIIEPAVTGSAILEWRELTAWSLLGVGRRREALGCATEAVRLARRWGAPRTLGYALHTLSGLVPAPKAAPLLREAVHLFEGCATADRLARARLDLGALLARSAAGRAEGVVLLQQASDYARATEVPDLAEQATRILAGHGIAVTVPRDSPRHLLTAGERRVVDLAVAGHTNREIAQHLFVTVKAVEWHLSNAYRKLSISSRTQLPAALAAQPPAAREDANSSAR
ncbi:MAG TPA: AAA family ATPase [Nocardioidaceae bacterium]|nr:AAA family ATPase [Nocardioidaceae bacterium]